MPSEIIEHPLLNPWQHFTIYATHNVRIELIDITIGLFGLLSIAFYCRGNEQE